MPLIPKAFSAELYTFIQQQNAAPVQDSQVAIQQYCDKIEELVYKAIQNATIVIPAGTVIVLAPPPAGAGSNPAPIILPPGSIK